MKDKLKTGAVAASVGISSLSSPANAQIQDEAVSALTMLGFPQAASQKVVKAIIKEQPAVSVEAAIKEALRRM